VIDIRISDIRLKGLFSTNLELCC